MLESRLQSTAQVQKKRGGVRPAFQSPHPMYDLIKVASSEKHTQFSLRVQKL